MQIMRTNWFYWVHIYLHTRELCIYMYVGECELRMYLSTVLNRFAVNIHTLQQKH